MKFKPGDPVWAHTIGGLYGISAGEYAAVVLGICNGSKCLFHEGGKCYQIDVLEIKSPVPDQNWCSHEDALRPRRDDYQQHEPRVTRADLDRALNAPLEKEKVTLTSGSIWGN